jgi:hypothetical protein
MTLEPPGDTGGSRPQRMERGDDGGGHTHGVRYAERASGGMHSVCRCIYAHAARFVRRRRNRRSQRVAIVPQQSVQKLQGRRPGWARTQMIASCTVSVR